MVIKGFFRAFFSIFKARKEKAPKIGERVFEEKTETPKKVKKIYSVWDFIEFKKDSQADHLSRVVGFDEWITMREIRRRIKEIIGIEYLNERSLYPYIKTMVDIGFFDVLGVGGVRKWKKNEMLFEIEEDKEQDETEFLKRKKKIRLIT